MGSHVHHAFAYTIICYATSWKIPPTKVALLVLRTGVRRFGASMLHLGLSKSDSCDCDAEQTADSITGGRCPI